MANNLKNINVRSFSGSSVPVGSEIGRILLRSKDSANVVKAIRATVKNKPQTVKLSKETLTALKAGAK